MSREILGNQLYHKEEFNKHVRVLETDDIKGLDGDAWVKIKEVRHILVLMSPYFKHFTNRTKLSMDDMDKLFKLDKYDYEYEIRPILKTMFETLMLKTKYVDSIHISEFHPNFMNINFSFLMFPITSIIAVLDSLLLDGKYNARFASPLYTSVDVYANKKMFGLFPVKCVEERFEVIEYSTFWFLEPFKKVMTNECTDDLKKIIIKEIKEYVILNEHDFKLKEKDIQVMDIYKSLYYIVFRY